MLEQNYRAKMQYSPDYSGMDMEQVDGCVWGGRGRERGLEGCTDVWKRGTGCTEDCIYQPKLGWIGGS